MVDLWAQVLLPHHEDSAPLRAVDCIVWVGAKWGVMVLGGVSEKSTRSGSLISYLIHELMLRWVREDRRCNSWMILMAVAILPSVKCLHPMISCVRFNSFLPLRPTQTLFWSLYVRYTVGSIGVAQDQWSVCPSMIQSGWHDAPIVDSFWGWSISSGALLSPAPGCGWGKVCLRLVLSIRATCLCHSSHSMFPIPNLIHVPFRRACIEVWPA